MKLNSLHIKNFRMLEDFAVQKLGKVNLIVGGNNSGKSTVLEALRIYAGNANLKLLQEIAKDRDEKYESDEDYSIIPFQAFFPKRKFFEADDQKIEIGEHNENYLTILHTYYREVIEESNNGNGVIENIINKIFISKSDIELAGILYDEIIEAIVIKKYNNEIVLKLNKINSRVGHYLNSDTNIIPCSFVSTQLPLKRIDKKILPPYYKERISKEEWLNNWNIIQRLSIEVTIIDALKIIDKEISNVKFIDDIPYVNVINLNDVIPLKSMGEGMLRILQLALKIPSAKNGFLLIDEFENGLHWSVQEKVWDMVFTMAEKLDIQVFATTHSYDVIESFAKVSTRRGASEGILFRMGRSAKTSDNGKIIAREFDDTELANITKANLEVR